MTYSVKWTNRFKKNYKLALRRGLNPELLEQVINKLRQDMPLEEKFHDHQLSGKMHLFRECHIQPDWLLVYLKEKDILTLTLVDTGTHSDLFR